jgi:hypothetical protein
MEQWLCFFNTWSSAIQAIMVIVLVLVTIWYAALTRSIAKSNKLAVAAMNSQIKNMIRPYITITLTQTSETLVSMIIANTGKSSAENLRLQIDRDFFQLGYKEDNLAKLYLFENVIPSFPPESQFVFPLITSLEVKDDKSENPLSPSMFNITATYSFSGETVTEKTMIDLKVFRGIWMPSKTIQEKLSELTTELKELKEFIIKKFAN